MTFTIKPVGSHLLIFRAVPHGGAFIAELHTGPLDGGQTTQHKIPGIYISEHAALEAALRLGIRIASGTPHGTLTITLGRDITGFEVTMAKRNKKSEKKRPTGIPGTFEIDSDKSGLPTGNDGTFETKRDVIRPTGNPGTLENIDTPTLPGIDIEEIK